MWIGAIISRMDELDRRILALLVEDGRRTYDDIGRRVSLSAPSVKRRVDRLRASGALEGFTAVVDHGAMGGSGGGGSGSRWCKGRGSGRGGLRRWRERDRGLGCARGPGARR